MYLVFTWCESWSLFLIWCNRWLKLLGFQYCHGCSFRSGGHIGISAFFQRSRSANMSPDKTAQKPILTLQIWLLRVFFIRPRNWITHFCASAIRASLRPFMGKWQKIKIDDKVTKQNTRYFCEGKIVQNCPTFYDIAAWAAQALLSHWDYPLSFALIFRYRIF